MPNSTAYIVGILNVTPDSFSDGGEHLSIDAALAHARRMRDEGADIIDIGGESSRPGSEPVPEDEELRRVIPVIEALAKEGFPLPLSIDTYKPRVAREALAAGASIVNDITGLGSPEMRAAAAAARQVILMHMQGEPKTMQADPAYGDVVSDIRDFFRARIALAKEAGITDIVLDPGLGFGKTLEHNLAILRRLGEFADLGFPILVGVSRKAFIGALTEGAPADDRLEGTIAAVVVARMNGASYFRVHDVRACRRALQVADALAAAPVS